jgi:hypothetical protein
LYEVGYSVGAVCLAGYIHHVPNLSAIAQGFYCFGICMEQTDNTVQWGWQPYFSSGVMVLRLKKCNDQAAHMHDTPPVKVKHL